MSRVRGSVTNNNGFWIGWLDLLTPSFTVTLRPNYNQLLQLTIDDCLRLVPFLTGLRVSSLPLWLTWFWFTNRSLLQLPLSAGYHSTAEHWTQLNYWTAFWILFQLNHDDWLNQFRALFLIHFIQSLMQHYNFEFFLYCITTCFGHTGPSSGALMPQLSHCNLCIKC
jgi:hypothetical protein